MRTWIARTATLVGVLAAVSVARAQDASNLETDENGVTYRVTRRVVNRAIPATEIQTREEKVYRPRVATEYQTVPRTYVTPVTEYRWVARQRGWWNPFVQPYWTHQLEPFTRWESVQGSAHVPVARTEWVEEHRSVQVPVTTYRNVQEEYTSRVAVSASPLSGGGTSVANRSSTSNRYGGERLDNDPPRDASNWRR